MRLRLNRLPPKRIRYRRTIGIAVTSTVPEDKYVGEDTDREKKNKKNPQHRVHHLVLYRALVFKLCTVRHDSLDRTKHTHFLFSVRLNTTLTHLPSALCDASTFVNEGRILDKCFLPQSNFRQNGSD